MKLSHSIRLRLVGWFLGAVDKRGEFVAEYLRHKQVNSQSGTNARFGLAAEINDGFRKGQIDDAAVHNPAFGNERGCQGTLLDRLRNDPVYVAYAKRLATANHNLIRHQKYSPGLNLLTVHLPQGSVESEQAAE